jgi:signal transduction histidine kinase
MLLTVWAILIAAGVTAYLTTRSVLLANLDQALLTRATPLNQSTGYVVHSGSQIVDSTVKTRASEVAKLVLLEAKFVTADDGTRVRSARIQVSRHNDEGNVLTEEIIERESAEPFDRLLNRLAIALLVVGCAGGVVAAFVARAVARIALRPLHSTAQTIGSIDERNLSRRIDSTKLAPELLPVAEKLNEMLARLEASFDNRKQFLADASHELRTPVAAMVTTLEVSLRRLRDAEAYRETMETCLADARLLRKLVEALMLQARSEIGAFQEDSVPTDVAARLGECVAILQAMAEQKNVSLRLSLDEPVTLVLPPGRLKQVVMGLLENAIDHNRPGGSVELIAGVEYGRLQILIKDTGPGIAPEHLPRIFEPFYRASRSRDASGHLGLGLYLVKSHVAAMDGNCTVESEVGKGTTFRVLLPARKLLEKPIETAVAW